MLGPEPILGEYATKKYTYLELVSLNYCCCFKKNARYAKYEAHKKIINERMDVANIIQSVGYVIALSNVFMEPYHLKLTSHFKKQENEEAKLAHSITIDEAVQKLKDNLKNPELEGTIKRRVDKFLISVIEESEKKIQRKIQNLPTETQED